MCCETKPTHLVVCDAAHKQEFVRSCVDLCYVLKKVRDSRAEAQEPSEQNGRGQEKVAQALLTFTVSLKAQRSSSVDIQM